MEQGAEKEATASRGFATHSRVLLPCKPETYFRSSLLFLRKNRMLSQARVLSSFASLATRNRELSRSLRIVGALGNENLDAPDVTNGNQKSLF